MRLKMKVELTEEQKREELAELIELYGEEMVKNVVDEAELLMNRL